MDIRGVGVLVTGASRGLGAALAAELARQGAKVAMVARSAPALEQAVDAIRRQGGEAYSVVADIGHKDATYRIAGAAAALVGPVQILINNASSLGRTPLVHLLDTDCEDLERVLTVNLVGPFRLTKAVVGAMALRGGGLVVHVTSDASVTPYARWGAYGVSKAALDHLGRIWAAELEETGVRFLSVDPGEMDTGMHAEAMPEADPAALARPADIARRIVTMIARAESHPSGSRLEVSAIVGDR